MHLSFFQEAVIYRLGMQVMQIVQALSSSTLLTGAVQMIGGTDEQPELHSTLMQQRTFAAAALHSLDCSMPHASTTQGPYTLNPNLRNPSF